MSVVDFIKLGSYVKTLSAIAKSHTETLGVFNTTFSRHSDQIRKLEGRCFALEMRLDRLEATSERNTNA